jgi:hypothetical protein
MTIDEQGFLSPEIAIGVGSWSKNYRRHLHPARAWWSVAGGSDHSFLETPRGTHEVAGGDVSSTQSGPAFQAVYGIRGPLGAHEAYRQIYPRLGLDKARRRSIQGSGAPYANQFPKSWRHLILRQIRRLEKRFMSRFSKCRAFYEALLTDEIHSRLDVTWPIA